MPHQKMNLSGQAIYAPKKVYLSKSSSDCVVSEDNEKTKDRVDNSAVTDMFEIQSREYLSLLGRPSTIPKPFYTPSCSGQYNLNSGTGCGQLYTGNEIDQQTASYLPSLNSSSQGLNLLSSVISSTGPTQQSFANRLFEGQHSFTPNFVDTRKLSSAFYPKEPVEQVYSENVESGRQPYTENVGPVSVSASKVTAANIRQVPSLNSSEVSYVDACQADFVNVSQAPSVFASQALNVYASQAPSVYASQAAAVCTSQSTSVYSSQSSNAYTSHASSVCTSQAPSVFANQVPFENIASSLGQTVEAYNTCQFPSTTKSLNVIESGQVVSGKGAVGLDTETKGNSGIVENPLNDLKDVQTLSENTGNSSNVIQSISACSIASCDSTQSPLTFNQGFVNSPESWTFSPLVPFSISEECGSPFTVMPEVTIQSTLDQLQDDITSSVSESKDMSSSKSLVSTLKNQTDTSMTWAQRYGINIHAKLKTPLSQSFNRISLADIEEFSGKIVPGKRKCQESCTSDNKLLGPSEPKKSSASPGEMVSSKIASDVLSSCQVSSTDMNQEFSTERSYQGQNKTELSPMPSSTSEVPIVAPKMYGIGEEDSNEISSSGGVNDYVQTAGSETCQVCGDKAAGFYCGAFICEACKKFFMRASKLDKLKYVCLRTGKCEITKESRVQCQFCRYQKCVSLKMYCPGSGENKKKGKKIGDIPCRVCSAPSSGFHFGALTCEGCKGFFRRMAKERECQRYKCSKNGSCEVNTITRNLCKACRYRKCLECGMSIEASRIGRQPNSVKHAISIEAEKQGKPHSTEKMVNEGIIINDMEAIVNTAVPATVEELAQIALDVQPNQLDVKKTKSEVTDPEVTGKNYFEITPPPVVLSEIKQEPQSPVAAMMNPLTSRGSSSTNSIEDSINSEKTKEILDKCADCNVELEHLLPVNTNIEEDELADFSSVKSTWANMMSSFEFTARKLIKFSKKVPGFRAISLDDQIKLIQGSIYPIVVLNCSRSFDFETEQYSYFNYTPRQREAIHSFFPMLKILKRHFIHTGIMVKLMNLSSMEYTFLSILLLLNSDVENLEDSESVHKLQLDTTFALQYHEETTYTDGSTRFGMLLLRLAELHFILMQHNSAITVMLKKNPELTLPQMYKEMFGEKVLDN